jgi:hypothetical protein
MGIKIAAIGYWFKSDYSIPLIVMDELAKMGVEVIDLSMGAIKAASVLDSISTNKLIVLASAKRGKVELRVYRPQVNSSFSDFYDIYSNIKAYYMDIDSFLKTANALGTLPEDIMIVECEVVKEDEGEELSEWGKECKELMKAKVMELLR